VTAVDTSVCVPALLAWHEAHEQSRRAAASAKLPAHALLETYSVLTRLPSPHRLSGEIAARLLAEWFPAMRVLLPSARLQRSVVSQVAATAIEGGAAYDALIGLVALEHDELLLTRDRRAATTYSRLGVDYELLS
jgi:predicted nucleic acid-binding protein